LHRKKAFLLAPGLHPNPAGAWEPSPLKHPAGAWGTQPAKAVITTVLDL